MINVELAIFVNEFSKVLEVRASIPIRRAISKTKIIIQAS